MVQILNWSVEASVKQLSFFYIHVVHIASDLLCITGYM